MLKKFFVLFGILFVLPVVASTVSNSGTSVTVSPKALSSVPLDEAAIRVYAARTWGLKKYLAVHTWVALKDAGESEFTRYEIFGWAKYRDEEVLVSHVGDHDAPWYGNLPTLLVDISGEEAKNLIGQVEQAIENYPYRNSYTLYPGPNSNTFTAYIGRHVPELKLDLPSTAIGKDYVKLGQAFSPAVSGTGYQLSLWGLLGLTLAREEGLELNLLGLNFELDVFDAAIELPGVGRIGKQQVDKPKAEL